MNYLQMAGAWLIVFILALVVLEFTLIHLVAKAARMKNRSYRSFWWLSFIFRSGVLALIVASLPFNDYDPRSPMVESNPSTTPPLSYVNPHSKRPLIESSEKALLWISGVALIGSLIGGLVTVGEASGLIPQSQSGASTSGLCDRNFTTHEIVDLGYTDQGNCLAYRYWTDAEKATATSTPGYGYFEDIYVKATTFCSVVKASVSFLNSSGNTIDSKTYTKKNIASGSTTKIQVENTKNWDNLSIVLSCDGV